MPLSGHEALDAGIAERYRLLPIFGLTADDVADRDTLVETLLAAFVLPQTKTTVLQDGMTGRRREVGDINGRVVDASGVQGLDTRSTLPWSRLSVASRPWPPIRPREPLPYFSAWPRRWSIGIRPPPSPSVSSRGVGARRSRGLVDVLEDEVAGGPVGPRPKRMGSSHRIDEKRELRITSTLPAQRWLLRQHPRGFRKPKGLPGPIDRSSARSVASPR